MVALQVKRPGMGDVRLKGPVGVADHRLVVDHLLPVERDGGVTIHDGDLVALPLASRFARVLSGFDPAEDGADALQALHATVPIDHLSLVGSADVYPAVSSGRNVEFDGQLGVSEDPFRP